MILVLYVTTWVVDKLLDVDAFAKFTSGISFLQLHETRRGSLTAVRGYKCSLLCVIVTVEFDNVLYAERARATECCMPQQSTL